MAGIGIRMTRIFSKRSLFASIWGLMFSLNYTAGPMLTVIACMMGMYGALDFASLSYLERTLFTATVLYVFIFSLLCAAPFNSVLSKYMSDRIFLERLDDIRPCVYVGISLSIGLSALMGIPFCLRVYFVGGISAPYVLVCYLCFMSLSLVMAAMVYNAILKHYRKIMAFFSAGMLTSFLLSLLLVRLLRVDTTLGMLLALTAGFLLIAVLELANVLRNFRKNSGEYRLVLSYFKTFWPLIGANFLYIFGLFAHNFVYWFHPWQLRVAHSFISNEAYDMAGFAAMLTNISGTVLFITQVEMHFHERYARFTTAVIGGSLASIRQSKERMFETLYEQMLTMCTRQFIISVIFFMIANIALPLMGFYGATLQIYPMLAVGYFISFIMYAGLLFLYYFNDYYGALAASALFAGVTLLGSVLASRLTPYWYGSGFALGSLCAFILIFRRLLYIQGQIDYYTFCTGSILKRGEGPKPDPVVFRREGIRP